LVFDSNTALIDIGAFKDNLGMIIKCNPAAEKITGYSKNELLAMNISECMPSPFKENHQDFLLKFFKSGVTKFLFRENK
jgi:PAS domain S-box-containing protein